MADYHAILKRTLDGLGDTTPQLRAKLFERARATIERQLETANPPMSGEAIAAQKAHLEAAIASLENEFQAADTVEPPAMVHSAAAVENQNLHGGVGQADPSQADTSADVPVEMSPAYGEGIPAATPEEPLETPETHAGNDEPVGISPVEEDLYVPASNIEPPARSSSLSVLILGVVAALLIGGGAAALWSNRTSLLNAFGQLSGGPTSSGGNQTGSAKSGGSQGDASSSAVSTVKDDEKLPHPQPLERRPTRNLTSD